MKIPDFIQFFIHPAEEGGYYAEAVGYSIYTQGETIDETVHNIREAVETHFDIEEAKAVPILANFQVPHFA